MTTLCPAVGEAIEIWLKAEGRIDAERDPFEFDERDPVVNRADKEYLFHLERGVLELARPYSHPNRGLPQAWIAATARHTGAPL